MDFKDYPVSKRAGRVGWEGASPSSYNLFNEKKPLERRPQPPRGGEFRKAYAQIKRKGQVSGREIPHQTKNKHHHHTNPPAPTQNTPQKRTQKPTNTKKQKLKNRAHFPGRVQAKNAGPGEMEIKWESQKTEDLVGGGKS